jgi:hypothetical protein
MPDRSPLGAVPLAGRMLSILHRRTRSDVDGSAICKP